MKISWTVLRTVLAVTCAIFFSLLMQVAILMVTFDSHLLDPATYKNTLVAQKVYTRLPRVMADQLVLTMDYNVCSENPFMCENIPPEFMTCVSQQLDGTRIEALSSENQVLTSVEKSLIQPCVDNYLTDASSQSDVKTAPDFMKELKIADWEKILVSLFPENELRAMTENLISKIFAYLNGKQESVNLSFLELKARVSGPKGTDAVMDLIRAQPACKDAEIDPMIGSIKDGSAPEVFCYPPEQRLIEVRPDIQELLVQTSQSIPDEQVLLDAETGENTAEGGGLGGSLKNIHIALRLSPVVALGFLLAVTFLVIRTPRTWLRWWGIPSFFTGLIVIVVALSTSTLFDQLWVNFLILKIPSYLSVGLVELLRGISNALIRRMVMGMGMGGLIFTVFGLAMWIGSSRMKVEN